MKDKSGHMTQKIAMVGVLTALAMIFSYLESFIPLPIGIPGVKLGLANLVVVVSLYILGWKEALGISFVRIVLMSVLFGTGASFLYSLAGGMLSFLVMVLLKKTDWFSVKGVSLAGGVFHNIGQLLAAMLVLENINILYYFAILGICGIITGTVIGFIACQIIQNRKIIQEF